MWTVKVKRGQYTWTWKDTSCAAAAQRAQNIAREGFLTAIGKRGSLELVLPQHISSIKVIAPRQAPTR